MSEAGGYAGADSAKGEWQSRGNSHTGTLLYQKEKGEQGSMPYQVLRENGQVYWNEYKTLLNSESAGCLKEFLL